MRTDALAMDDLFATASLGAPENTVGFVLWRIVHRYVREIDRALAPLDITHLQFTTLTLAAWLGKSGHAVTQGELARFGDIHPMQVSLMLKALEGKAMVTRLRSRSDVRAKHVELTQAGLETLCLALPIAIDIQQRLFGDQGRPGGTLLTSLLQVEHEHPPGQVQASSRASPYRDAARLKGQVEAVERALEGEARCEQVMHLIAGARSAMAGLMAEMVEDHVRTHLVDLETHSGALNAEAVEQLLDVVRTYLK